MFQLSFYFLINMCTLRALGHFFGGVISHLQPVSKSPDIGTWVGGGGSWGLGYADWLHLSPLALKAHIRFQCYFSHYSVCHQR